MLSALLVSDMSLSKLQEMGKDRGGLACCSSWGCKQLEPTLRLIDSTAAKKEQLHTAARLIFRHCVSERLTRKSALFVIL